MSIKIKTHSKKEIIDITDLINEKISGESKNVHLCNIFVKHTTAAITTADLDPGTDQDYVDAFEEIIPKLKYNHPHDPAHMPDHILSTIIGTSITIPVANGQLDLGTWQRVVLIELNGPRKREVIFSTIQS